MRPAAGRDDLRPGLRHRRLPARRARLHRREPPDLDRDQKKHLRLRGAARAGDRRRRRPPLRDEPAPARHRPDGRRGREPPIAADDSLGADPGDRFDVVLTNPPFGKKSSVTVVNEEGEQEREALTVIRDDFWASTSNKQLNFVQHVKTLLKINGRAAVVVPDNVLFEGGRRRDGPPQAAARVRRPHPAAPARPASSTPRASRRTSSSSTASRPARSRGRRSSGSTTCAPTSTSR